MFFAKTAALVLVIAVSDLIEELDQLRDHQLYGRVSGILGLLVEVVGLEHALAIGTRCMLEARDERKVPVEVIGFRGGRALTLPFGSLDGVGLGCKAVLAEGAAVVRPTEAWLGRVVNALGEPLDGKGPLPVGPSPVPLRAPPPPAHQRRRLGPKVDLGVRAINTFLTCCQGQRMGIFSGSGVGKSVLLSMLARYTALDVNVIGLIGERGREVQDWLEGRSRTRGARPLRRRRRHLGRAAIDAPSGGPSDHDAGRVLS